MPNIGLLQAIGDPFNRPVEVEPEPEFSPQFDPAIEAILADTGIDVETRRALRAQESKRLRLLRVQHDIARLENQSTREGLKKDGLISYIGPVPIGFQLGTYAGIKSGPTRFLVDLVADPVNFIGGIGALTKIGRASKFLKGLSPAAKAARIVEGAELLAKTSVDDGLRLALKTAAEAGDAKAIRKAFNAIKKAKVGPEDIEKLAKAGAEDDFLKILKDPGKELKGLREAFELDRNRTIGTLKSSFTDRVAAGQSSLINLTNPITGTEYGSIRLPELVKAISGDTGDLARAGQKTLDSLKETGRSFIQGAKEAADVTDVLVKGPKLSALDPTNSAAMLKAYDEFSRGLEASLDPSNELGRWLVGAKPIGEKGQPTAKFLAGARATGWAGEELPVYEVAKNTITGVQNIGDRMEQVMKAAFRDSPKLLDEAVGFIEGTVKEGDFLPKLNDVQRAIIDRRQQLIGTLEKSAKKFGVIDDGLEGYVHHATRIKDPQLARVHRERMLRHLTKQREKFEAQSFRFNRRLPKGKVGIRRTFDTVAELKKYIKDHPESGIQLATENLAELDRLYYSSLGTSMIRNQMLHTMQHLNLDIAGMPMALKLPPKGGGVKLSKADKLADEIIKANPKAYEKVKGEGPFSDWFFHKEVAEQVRSMFGRDFIADKGLDDGVFGKIIQGANFVNSVGKAALFNLWPFFHGAALTYSNFAFLPPKVAAETSVGVTKFALGKLWNPQVASEQVLKMLSSVVDAAGGKTGDRVLAGDVIKEMLTQSGMRFARPSLDTGYETIHSALSSVAETLPAAGESLAKLGKAYNDLGDKGLWSIYHDGLKSFAWVHTRNKFLRKNPAKYATEASRYALNSEVGRMVDQAYGGILDRLMLSPNMRRASRYAMLAPDWTISNFMMARDLFVNIPGIRDTVIGKRLTRDALLRDERFRAALGYNMRAATYAFIAGNVLNFMFNGRFLWDNDDAAVDPVTGLKTRIELPYTRSDGRRQFMDITKQFAEPLKLMLNPTEFVSSKKGVLPRVYDATIVGIDSFGRPIAGGEKGPFREAIQRIAHTTGQFAPITAQSFTQAAQGQRHPASAALSALSGFSVRSEDQEFYNRRKRIEALRLELELERSR